MDFIQLDEKITVAENHQLKIGTLWIGHKLPPIEQLCLASMVSQGHDVTLYSYNDLSVPSGVKLEDANSIVPRSKVFTYKKTGHPATFSDWFRIEMIARSDKVWLDTDVMLFKPLSPKHEYLFFGGHHRAYGLMANNFVLVYPRHSELSASLISYFHNPVRFLPLMTWHRAVRIGLRRVLIGEWDLGQFRWGLFGMALLKKELHRLNLFNYVLVGDSRLIEGAKQILAPNGVHSEAFRKAELAHFYTSGISNNDLDIDHPAVGSIYEHCINVYGHRTEHYASFRI